METFVQYFTLDRTLDILGFITGILYLYWEYFANPKLWIANIIMPVIMFWVYLSRGLYADFVMNIYYFLITVYGFIVWTRKSRGAKGTDGNVKKGSVIGITHIPVKWLLVALAAFLLIYAGIASWLIFCTDSNVPYLDAFTTSLSIVAMWMLAHKYIEQWLAWILVDAVTVYLYLYKDIPFSALRYAAYTVIAFFGYAKWKRMMKAQATD